MNSGERPRRRAGQAAHEAKPYGLGAGVRVADRRRHEVVAAMRRVMGAPLTRDDFLVRLPEARDAATRSAIVVDGVVRTAIVQGCGGDRCAAAQVFPTEDAVLAIDRPREHAEGRDIVVLRVRVAVEGVELATPDFRAVSEAHRVLDGACRQAERIERAWRDGRGRGRPTWAGEGWDD